MTERATNTVALANTLDDVDAPLNKTPISTG